MKKFYDIMCYDGGGYAQKNTKSSSSYERNKNLLSEIMMKKYDITEADLHDTNTVISKIRDINITEILNAK